ncbi:MAG: ATP-grasp domain-containing protein [Hyphococcus sp.]
MSYFGEFRINGNQLVATETGAAIPLTPGFAKEALRIASFVWLVNALRASRIVRGREPRARISFFPKKPRSYYAIWPVCQLADVKITDDPEEADLHFYFEDREFLTAPRPAPSAKPAFNIGCYDIRKSVVARVFEETFGYHLAVDPRVHQGPAVVKSEGNGKHDGRIIQCPVETPDRSLVYQRLVDNTFDGRDHVDIRTPIVGGAIPFVYLKRRTKEARFTNENHRVDLADTDAMLSREEQAKIIAFARAMRLDFGGLDVLRDRADGRIYVVDANKTDMGPPSALSGQGKLKAMRGLADAFAALVDDALKTA